MWHHSFDENTNYLKQVRARFDVQNYRKDIILLNIFQKTLVVPVLQRSYYACEC